ncbi:hypothetical protein [Mucilaginibacter sp. PPCGB 2223]|uniref:hypothetical protein n=1 Tax=Mucilaginibacter sp. PPCGB 2223 TaxID=1886027 RepID=UPI001586677A|nr:hypothetical protein [Mucilaginibacter sp. PPCGB 2223]
MDIDIINLLYGAKLVINNGTPCYHAKNKKPPTCVEGDLLFQVEQTGLKPNFLADLYAIENTAHFISSANEREVFIRQLRCGRRLC